MGDHHHDGTPRRLRLRLVCAQRPPETQAGAQTEFGLLDKRRGLLTGASEADGGARFDLDLTVALDAMGGVTFAGPYVQGKPVDRFLYLGWRQADGDANEWIRRWKVSLKGVSRAVIDELAAREGLVLRVGETGLDRVWLNGGDWMRFELDRDGETAIV